MTKLIVTDMDGTLLNDKRELPGSIWRTIEQLDEKGIRFAVASGRQYRTLADIFEPVKDKMLFMAENGTIVVNNSEVISKTVLDKKLVHQLIDTARKLDDCHIVLCGSETAYVESTNESFLEKTGYYFHHKEIVEDLKKVDADVLKFTICDFKNPEQYSYQYFEHFSDRAQIAVASEIWLDIMPLHVNKGSALKQMQQELGISNSETIVFGDYMNDFEMMEFSENSYAMANAHPEILGVSRFRTRLGNNENGVIETLKDLGLVV